MTFEEILPHLKKGKKVRRVQWAPKICLQLQIEETGSRSIRGLGFGSNIGIYYHFDQLDILAEDWIVL